MEHAWKITERLRVPFRSLLMEIDALIAQGVYPPGTPQIHSLREGPAVLQELEAGQTRGRHALDPWR